MKNQKRPTVAKEVFAVIPYTDRNGEEASRWLRVGAAFENRDGSMNVILDCAPIVPGARLQIRDPLPEDGPPRKSPKPAKAPPRKGRRRAEEEEEEEVDEDDLPF